jgi:hypothetical protein
MFSASIPAGLPITEEARLLAYLKVKFQPGYFFKSDLPNIARHFGKDPRTVAKLLKSLLDEKLVGQDCKAFYLRSWRHITNELKFNTQAFRASLREIADKEIFECSLFGAKVTSIQKAIRRGRGRAGQRGCTNQTSPSSGFFAKACRVSSGKVSSLKRKAASLGLVQVSKSFEDFGPGSGHAAKILQRERPGIFLRGGRLAKRKPDQIVSAVETFRIKSRKSKAIKYGTY